MMAPPVCARQPAGNAVSHVLHGITGVLILIAIFQHGYPQPDRDLDGEESPHLGWDVFRPTSPPTMMAHLVRARQRTVSDVLYGIIGVLILVAIFQRGPRAVRKLSSRASRLIVMRPLYS